VVAGGKVKALSGGVPVMEIASRSVRFEPNDPVSVNISGPGEKVKVLLPLT
jgi:hypothetical protein